MSVAPETPERGVRQTTLKYRRLRLLALLTPGFIGLLLPVLSGPSEPTNAGSLGIGESLIPLLAILLLLIGGVAVHRKALTDYQSKGRAYWKTVTFIATPVIIGVPIAWMVLEASAGLWLAANGWSALPNFPPYSQVSFQTAEFQYTASINSIGIRDREINIKDKSGLRIVAIGDSFTYGWGVSQNECWPKVLERCLIENGREVEVLNLGCPGTSVDAYAEIAERGVPLLKPDLVLIAILQGDDLKQLDMGRTTRRLAAASSVRTLLTHALRPIPISAQQVRQQWKNAAPLIEARLTLEQRQRLSNMDAEINALFHQGDLNPNFAADAIQRPDYLEFTLEPDRPEYQRALATMTHCLERIRQTCHRENSRLIVVSVPWSYVSIRQLANARRIGFHIDDSSISSDAPDDAIRSACRNAGVVFHCFTSRFREVAAQRELFFAIDSHFNADGHSLYADEVCRMVLETVD